jgi:hypothetical protein
MGQPLPLLAQLLHCRSESQAVAQNPRLGGDRHLAGLMPHCLNAAGNLGAEGNGDAECPLGHPVFIPHIVIKNSVILIVVGVNAEL